MGALLGSTDGCAEAAAVWLPALPRTCKGSGVGALLTSGGCAVLAAARLLLPSLKLEGGGVGAARMAACWAESPAAAWPVAPPTARRRVGLGASCGPADGCPVDAAVWLVLPPRACEGPWVCSLGAKIAAAWLMLPSLKLEGGGAGGVAAMAPSAVTVG